ncbi:MAG: hypothetical protein OXL40_05870 [Bacteroidota bacterium]|nr:hypothetical protein [Bacteroidota bacterium]
MAGSIPWLLPLFKSIELPGGLRLEIRDLQAAGRYAAETGQLAEAPSPTVIQEYSLPIVADVDPNLTLAGLRIEIERRLARLAESAGIGSTKAGIHRLLRSLENRGILTPQQRRVLADMVGRLNSAVHGVSVDPQSAEWVLEDGSKILATLDKRIENQSMKVAERSGKHSIGA